jgi:hypothetical protein
MPKANININGVDFPADLMVLESIDIDVTLGFGWLHAFEGVVQSAQGSVFRGGATMMPPGISNFLEEKQVYFKCICIHIY